MKRLLTLIALLTTVSILAAEINPPYAPDRRPGEGEGPFERLIIRGATLDRRHRRAADRAGRHRHREATASARSAASAFRKCRSSRSGRPKDADEGDRRAPGCTSCPASSTCTATPAAKSRGRRRSTSSSCGWRTASPPCASRAAATAPTGALHERDRSARNEIVAPRLFPYIFTSAGMWDGGPIDTPEQARKFVQWAAKKGMRRHQDPRAPAIRSSIPRSSPPSSTKPTSSAPRHRPRTSRRWASRGRTSSPPRAWGCAAWSTGTACPSRSSPTGRSRTIRPSYNYNDEQRSLRPGGTALEAGRAAGQREVERRRSTSCSKPNFNIDPTLHDLRGEPRPDARHARRVARQVHAAVALEVLPAEPRRARRVLVRLDHRRRDRVEEQLPPLDAASSTTTRTAAAASPPAPTPASSSSSTASTTSASWSCCRKPASIRWR